MKTGIQIMSMLITLICMSLLWTSTPASEYKVAQKFHLSGNEGWDFLIADEATGRIFVSHGNQVQVVNEKDGKLLGTIQDTKGVHGIALAPELNKGFISNGKDTTVTVFNYKTLETIQKVKVTGINPDAILYPTFQGPLFQLFAFSS